MSPSELESPAAEIKPLSRREQVTIFALHILFFVLICGCCGPTGPFTCQAPMDGGWRADLILIWHAILNGTIGAFVARCRILHLERRHPQHVMVDPEAGRWIVAALVLLGLTFGVETMRPRPAFHAIEEDAPPPAMEVEPPEREASDAPPRIPRSRNL